MLAFLGVCFGLFVSIAAGAPLNSTTLSPAETTDCNSEDVYDQRQNGTENYRIHVNGIVVLVAPADTVLQAAQLPNLQTGTESDVSTEIPDVQVYPKRPSVNEKMPAQGTALDTAYSSSQDNEKNHLKLLNLLHMFRSMKHDTGETIRHQLQQLNPLQR